MMEAPDVQEKKGGAMPRIGPTELIIILVIILVIFGAGKLPEIGGAIGKGIRSFRRSVSSDEQEDKAKDEKTGQKTGETKT
jgi:sec-independent protein translocase protein TatA